MSTLLRRDPEVAKAIGDETARQRRTINLIASENYASKAVLEAQGSVLTNKYAEGYPGRRYYGGCEFIDVAETIAIDRAKALFGVEHANVQPHSGAQANMAAYFALLKPGGHRHGPEPGPRRPPDPREPRQFFLQALQFRSVQRRHGAGAYRLRRPRTAGEGAPGPS